MADQFQSQIDVLTGDAGVDVGLKSPQSSDINKDQNVSDEQIAQWISTIISTIDKQERTTRNLMLRLWKYLELLWSGAGNYYWDHMTGQWRAVTQEDIALLSQNTDIDPTLLNKIINLIRPYGESLVGVLTTGAPRVVYFPRDADNVDDILTSKAYSNIEKRIFDDNMMPIRLMEMLVKLWNGGFVAVYNYSHADKKYGTFNQPVFANRDYTQSSLICTNCGNEQLGEETPIEPSEEASGNQDEGEEIAGPTDLSHGEILGEDKSELGDQNSQNPMMDMGMMDEMPSATMSMCPQCGMETPHLDTMNTGNKDFHIDDEQIPKSRQMINVYGPMNVKIPVTATRREHVIWLILEEDVHVAFFRDLYPEHRGKIQATTGSDLDVDRMARATQEITDEVLRNTATKRLCWLKPAAFEIIEHEDQINILKKKYPNGIMAVFSGDTFLELEESDLDDHWSLSYNPMYNRMHGDPLGKALIGLHESANDLFQLEIDTVRFSIPTTFADPQFFDFQAWAQTRARPGDVAPLKRPPGGSISDVFAETKTATIPKEVENLDVKIRELFQFISGVLPSVFGGPAGPGSTKTLGEYEQSRNQAMQRLSIPWKVIQVLYAEMMSRSVKAYRKDLREDEHFVQKKGESFLNVWIRKSDLNGEVGEVRPELSEQFPMTWPMISQKVMELLGMNNQAIMAILLHPENVELIYQALGITDIHIPGEDQRNKQLYEISEMLSNTQPVTDEAGNPMPPAPNIDPNTGQLTSSVQPEMIDDHNIHMAITAAFLSSPMGIDLKMSNQAAYTDIMLHYQAHQMIIMQQQMQAQAAANQAPSGEQVEGNA